MLILASVWLFCAAVFLETAHRAPVIEYWGD
jgi:hypothetical protein